MFKLSGGPPPSNGLVVQKGITADTSEMWDIISNDLNLQVDTDYATSAGELVVEYPTGKKVRMGTKMKCADVRDCPIKIKCQALAGAQDDLYLIAFLNPDVPSMEKPLQRYAITLCET